jgi:hypothetical protein
MLLHLRTVRMKHKLYVTVKIQTNKRFLAKTHEIREPQYIKREYKSVSYWRYFNLRSARS